MKSAVVITAAVLIAGCSGSGGPSPDLTAPLPCPPGLVRDGNVCLPESCGTGTWGDIELEPGAVYVDASADSGGDGSITRPLTSIQDGIDRAADVHATLVAVAEGQYTGPVVFDRYHDGIDLVGRCPELVTVGCGDVGQAACVEIVGLNSLERGNVVEGLTVAEASFTSVWMTRGTMTLRDVVIRDGSHVGIYLEGPAPMMHLEQVTIRDTWPTFANSAGHGIVVKDGAALTGQDVTISGATEVGLMVEGSGSSADLADVVIEDTRLNGDGDYGYAVLINHGSSATLQRAVLRRNHRATVVVFHDDTVAELVDVTIEDSLSDDDNGAGFGLYGEGSCTIRLTGCLIDGSSDIGLAVTEGVTLEAHSLSIRDSRRVALMIDGPGTLATLDDIELEGTLRDVIETTGSGLLIQRDARATVEDLHSHDMEGPGLYVATAELRCLRCVLEDDGFAGAVLWDGKLELIDSTIGTQIADANAGGGVGLFAGRAWSAPSLLLHDTTIAEQQLAAVWIDGAGSYRIEDSVLSGSAGVLLGSHAILHGNALFVRGAVGTASPYGGLSISGTTFADSSSAGILLHGSSATLQDNLFEGNTWDLVQQSCDGDLAEPEGIEEVPHAVLCPRYDILVRSLDFTMYLEDSELQQ